MSGPKRNPDKLNTIGIVVVGICGAVLVYVTIVALEAFYMEDTVGVQTAADYGNQEKPAAGRKADELRNISEVGKNTGASTVHITIDDAMKLVVRDAAKDPTHLIPALPASTKATIEPIFGRPHPLGAAAPAAPAEGAGSAAGSGAGSAAPATLQPTGAGGHEPAPVPGAGAMPGAKTTVPAVGGGNGH